MSLKDTVYPVAFSAALRQRFLKDYSLLFEDNVSFNGTGSF